MMAVARPLCGASAAGFHRPCVLHNLGSLDCQHEMVAAAMNRHASPLSLGEGKEPSTGSGCNLSSG